MLDFLTFISEQWLLVSLLLVLIYVFVWRESKKGGQSLSHHEVTRLVNGDAALLLDIRDAKEFAEGHISGSINIPYNKINGRMAELEPHREKTIVLVDKFGQHAGSVGRELSKAGFNPARLQGGMSEWQSNNLPVARGRN